MENVYEKLAKLEKVRISENRAPFLVRKNGEILEPSRYQWQEEWKIFECQEEGIRIDAPEDENTTFTVGDKSIVICGDLCRIVAGHDAKIRAGNKCHIIAGNDSYLGMGENCTYKAGQNPVYMSGEGCEQVGFCPG